MCTRIRVRTPGRAASAALGAGPARVIAVFERSAYLETPAGLACVGRVGRGPLNASCDALPAGLAVGDELIALIEGEAWSPRPAPPWQAGRVAAALARLAAESRARLPAEGFGFLLDPARRRPAAVEALARWLARPAGIPAGAQSLIGFGPGLTPAGDDLVGGALCALHATGSIDAAERLAGWALPLAANATSRISRAHLACAAAGECGETVHEAILALLAGGPPALDRIDAIGHTSGWDALAGAVLALRALHES